MRAKKRHTHKYIRSICISTPDKTNKQDPQKVLRMADLVSLYCSPGAAVREDWWVYTTAVSQDAFLSQAERGRLGSAAAVKIKQHFMLCL